MTLDSFLVIAKRFLRGFIAGGIGSVGALLYAGVNISSPDDLRKLAIALAAAFISGGLLAIDKMLRWKDEPESEA